jgi:membrane protease YdiL (CAAX protease family)
VAWLAIALAFLPFMAKRIALLGAPDFHNWLAWDYATHSVALIGVMLAYRAGLIRALPARAPLLASGVVFVLAFSLARLQQLHVDPILWDNLPYFRYAKTPPIRDRDLLLFDLFVGIWLVAISEEFIFRRFLFALLERLGAGRFVVVLASSAMFGLIHITSGLDAAVSAMLLGLILGTVFYATRRLSLCILLHYIDDFLIFGGNATNSGMWGAPGS